MKPSGLQILGSGGSLAGIGNAAVELAEAEGYWGGSSGVRGALRHAIGGSYAVQGSPIKDWWGERVSTMTGLAAPYTSYPEKAKDEDLDLWYAKDGPKFKELKDKYWIGGHDMTDMADTVNNRVGVDNLSGLSFEERYEKTKDMVVEQLEYFIETGGAFKKGLPVWNTEVRRSNKNKTVKDDGKIKSVKDAQIQLAHLEETKENLIESKRIGLLSQGDRGELSDFEQLAETTREERHMGKINLKSRLKERSEKMKEDIDEFKKINTTRLSETKEVGRGKAKVSTENAQQAKKELENLEDDYRRSIEGIERVQKQIDEGKVLYEEDWFGEIMKEQEFLKAGNDWVLQ